LATVGHLPKNTAAPDCSNTACNFGTPLPIPNPTSPTLTTCVLNTFSSPASGTLDLSTGASSTNVALVSDTYLTGNAGQPCPKCSGHGTPSSPGDRHLRSRPAGRHGLHLHQLDRLHP
jgi:hypothetical protein